MFIGHWAPALAAAAISPKAPRLGVLFIAAQLVDWAFFGLLLTGAEQMRVTPGISVMNPMDLFHMPYTHSLLGSAVFAAVFGGLLWWLTRNRTTALTGAAVVLSHWFLDLLVHVPDLTLAGSPPKLGLGLWNHPAIEIPLELGITFGALWWFAKVRRAKPGPVVILGLVLLLLQTVSWFAPVEPEVTSGTSLIAFLAFTLATLAAWWVGKSTALITRPG